MGWWCGMGACCCRCLFCFAAGTLPLGTLCCPHLPTIQSPPGLQVVANGKGYNNHRCGWQGVNGGGA